MLVIKIYKEIVDCLFLAIKIAILFNTGDQTLLHLTLYQTKTSTYVLVFVIRCITYARIKNTAKIAVATSYTYTAYENNLNLANAIFDKSTI